LSGRGRCREGVEGRDEKKWTDAEMKSRGGKGENAARGEVVERRGEGEEGEKNNCPFCTRIGTTVKLAGTCSCQL